MSGIDQDLPSFSDHEPWEWRVYRALVDFTIRLRHQSDFQRAIKVLREEWELDPMGEWLRPEAVTPFMRSPVLWELWDGLFLGPYPPSAEKDEGQRAAYEEHLGRLIRRFVPLERFPPAKVETGLFLDPGTLTRFHPLACFDSLCVLYDVLSLPAEIGIASPPYRVTDDRTAGDLLHIPEDATRSDAHQQVDQMFDWREHHRQEDEVDEPVGRRTLEDLKATYETWRLRRNGYRLREVAEELVTLGLDNNPRPESTISSRIGTAEDRWDLPDASKRGDEEVR